MGVKFKALIVDDERYAREELSHLLGEFPNIEVAGEAETGEAALVKCLQIQPDVVFLDVEMPRMNGMETAKSLLELKKVPIIVFATAYPQFAAEAFRYEAVDYLLKPYDEDQIREAVSRIEKLLSPAEGIGETKPIGKLAIDEEGEIIYIDPEEILYIFRNDKFTKIISKRGEYEIKTPLKDLQSRLRAYSFFRIHKSYLVNLAHITRLTPWFNGAYQLEVAGRDELLSVSRNYVKALRSRLEL